MEAYFLPDECTLDHSQIISPKIDNKWLYFCAKWIAEQRPLPTNLEVTFRKGRVSIDPLQLNLQENLQEMIDSVKIIERVSNEEYDQLLATSVVFLHLVDASAVNTVIECIVRNTPIVANRHPALEEYLGSDYPLFYETLDEIPELLKEQKIEQAHQYLSDLDNDELRIDTFMKSVSEIIKG